MNSGLIIVESPAKVKTIKKFLGKDYAVEASVGHVRDLPTKKLGVDEEKGFEPEYGVIQGKQKIVTKLRQAAKQAATVYLAPDPDREGEAIAWHVAELIKTANSNIQRIQFNEITKRAVKEALEHPREINEKLFLSQQARRILDRLVGYKVSPLLWKKVKRGISAGRVQSVALRLVVEREKERRAFVPEEYWLFKALVEGAVKPEFWIDLWKVDDKKPVIGSADDAKALEERLEGQPFVVADIAEKERKKTPPPPFITSTLQQAANQRLGYSAKRTMGAAQRLYEGVDLGERGTTALITYMRTDSVRVAAEAQEQAKDFIISTLGADYYPEKTRFFKSKGSAQDAHEAIRPIDVSITPDSIHSTLSGDLFRLYKLIWERFVASQMAQARFWDTTVTAEAAATKWRAKGERLIFPGFLKVYGMDTGQQAKVLPELQKGETLALLEMKKEQKFTQPPPRYTEASLVRELEEKGIGRPSTYAAIISTLLDRDYAKLEEKHFAPSELGFTVSDLLSDHFTQIMDVGFTAGMEEALDKVADGSIDWQKLLADFTGEFNPTLEKAATEMAAVKAGMETGLTCDQCGKPMVIKFGRNGEFLACSGYPDCKNTMDFTRDETGNITPIKREPEELKPVGVCPECGKDLVLKKARTGSRFIACTGYPDCKYTKSFSTGVPCPREGCDGQLVEKSSRRGKVFYACDNYPNCDYATWNWPIARACPQCDFPILTKKTTKARGEHIACPEKGCGYIEELDEES